MVRLALLALLGFASSSFSSRRVLRATRLRAGHHHRQGDAEESLWKDWMNGVPGRKMGLELEYCSNHTYRALLAEIAPNCIEDPDCDSWKIKAESTGDCYLYGPDGIPVFANSGEAVQEHGVELVSSVLSPGNNPGIAKEIYGMVRQMSRPGTRITPETGLHVHIDGAGLSLALLQQMVLLYAKYEPVVQSLVHPCRRGYRPGGAENTWFRPIALELIRNSTRMESWRQRVRITTSL
jgi:hypothetical protein